MSSPELERGEPTRRDARGVAAPSAGVARPAVGGPTRVRGRVLDAASGHAVPDGWVEILEERVRCEPDGSFQLELRSEEAAVTLLAGGRGYPARLWPLALEPEGAEIVRELRLPRGRRLAGVVLDLESGAPVADAQVSWGHLLYRGSASTDATGAFELAVHFEDDARGTQVTVTAQGSSVRRSTVASAARRRCPGDVRSRSPRRPPLASSRASSWRSSALPER